MVKAQEMSKSVDQMISEYISNLLKDNPEFTGNVQLNFFKGGLANLTKTESLKL